jgi:hypothetical protein
MNNEQFYAYYDTIEETGEVIYCGKGDKDRIRSPKRNRYYNIIANKYKLVRTVIETLDEDLALKYEDWLMEHYHTWIDDPLATEHACNIDGPSTNAGGRKRSKSLSRKGKTYIEMYGEERAQEIKDKTRLKNLGKKHKTRRSKEQKEKIKIATIEAMKRPEVREKIINKPPTSEETKNKIKAKRALQINLNKPVYQIDKVTNEIIAKFCSISEAVRKTGCCHISEVCEGKRKTSGGFIWRYVNDYENKEE